MLELLERPFYGMEPESPEGELVLEIDAGDTEHNADGGEEAGGTPE